MATNIISSIVSLVTGQTVLSVIDEASGQPIWTNIKCVSVEIESESAVTDNPVSPATLSGQETTDTFTQEYAQTLKIIQPSRVRMNIICPDIDTINQVINEFLDVQSTVTIETKSVIIPSLCISEMNLEQTAEMLNAARMNITLEQAVLSTAVGGFFPLQSADSSVYGIQFQTPMSITQTVSGLYSSISTRISSLL